LLGDEVVSTPTETIQSAQSALEGIFGAANESSAPGKPTSRQATVNDILGLFDSPAAPAASAHPPAPTPAAQITSLFAATPTTPTPAPAPTPANASYPAYQKNNLQITLTPQVSAAKPGVINILARFQVSGPNSVTNMNFQAAVPKARQIAIIPVGLFG